MVKINVGTAKWSRRYRAVLRKHLAQGAGASPQAALGLGRQAAALGLETLDLARFHAQAMTALKASGAPSWTSPKMIGRAQHFFAETILPIEKNHRSALSADVCIRQLSRILSRRTAESCAAARRLKRSILLRQGSEQSLEKSGKRQVKLLAELHRLQKHLRDLTRTSLSAQEDEQQRISFQLHDEISQALIAIDLRLLMLKKAARASTARLKKEIAKTQQLVKESVNKINQFTHEFGIQQ